MLENILFIAFLKTDFSLFKKGALIIEKMLDWVSSLTIFFSLFILLKNFFRVYKMAQIRV